MSAFEGTKLETVLRSGGRDTVIVTGAWTNMSIEHTSRTGADKGYFMIVPEDCCSTMNADWHRASVQYAMQNVAAVTKSGEVIAALSWRVIASEAKQSRLHASIRIASSLSLLAMTSAQYGSAHSRASGDQKNFCTLKWVRAFAGMSGSNICSNRQLQVFADEHALHRRPARHAARVLGPARKIVRHVVIKKRAAPPQPINQQIRIGDAVAFADRPRPGPILCSTASHKVRQVLRPVAATSSTARGSEA